MHPFNCKIQPKLNKCSPSAISLYLYHSTCCPLTIDEDTGIIRGIDPKNMQGEDIADRAAFVETSDSEIRQAYQQLIRWGIYIIEE